MRHTAALLAMALAPLASADRLINTPRGGKLPYGVARAEILFEPTIRRNTYVMVGIGLTTAFDAEIRTEHVEGREDATTFDIGYNVNAPLTDFAPGISVGMLDALDQTRDGRRYYLAITQRRSARESLIGGVAVEMTLGFTLGSRNAGFVGVSLPFSNDARLIAEHDGIRLTAGAEIKPRPNVALRVLFRPQETLIGLQTTLRF